MPVLATCRNATRSIAAPASGKFDLRRNQLRSLDPFLLLLQGPHMGVHPAPGEQLTMATALDDAPAFHDQDLIGIDDRGQPVRDGERGAAGRNAAEFRLNRLLRFGIERRSRLVENQDPGVLQQRPRNRTLCFSPPESFKPRSPTIASYLSGRLSIRSWICADWAAAITSSLLASGLP